ncbi:MAG: hypothetical protein UHH95_06810 [Oscillospiraceae bacterium]|nr:hypothetical protein [Oscillospiraceae bacterium]
MMIYFVSCIESEKGAEQDNQSSIPVFSEINNGFTAKETADCEESIYKIEFEFRMLSNDSVGNQWEKTVYINDREIKNGETITVKRAEEVAVKAVVVECDNIPDRGIGTIKLPIEDGESGFTKITVRENRGQYSGNTAQWEFRCSISAVYP